MHLRPDEKILHRYRHHPFPFFLQMLLMGAATVVLFAVINIFFPKATGQILITAQIILAVLLLLFIAHLVLIYWGDQFILTTHRLVVIDWKIFHVQTEEEISLFSIQEIETSDKGLLRYIPLFNYGTIMVRGEGNAMILFVDITAPDKIKHTILSTVPFSTT